MPYKTSKLVLFFFTIVLLVDTVTVFVSADILGIDDDQGFGDDLGLSHFVTGTCFTMPDDVDGIGRKMYFYVDSNIEYAPHTIKCAIYTNISGTNQGTLLTNSQTNETVIYEFPGGDFGWADCKFNDTHMPLLEEGTTYYLTIWTNGTWTEGASMEILWDNNVSNGSGTVEFTDLTYVAGDYSGFPSTFNQTALLPAYNGRIVIYCEYDNFGDPANVDATLYGNANLNISWTANDSADKTLVVRKRGSFPSSPTDAAATVIHNSTINYYNDTNIEYDYWYRLYSYNSSVNAYSDGVNLNFGGIVVNCYNESNASENLTFDVYITNEDGSDTYVDTGCDNPHVIDLADTPYGNKTIIQIKSSGYSTRYYYKDLEIPGGYLLNTYLLHNTLSNLYYVRVIDENDESIEDVKIMFRRYINSSVGFDNVSILYTDAYGQSDIYLEPDEVYKVNLSKSGYQTKTDDYIPDPAYYGIYYPKYFRLFFMTTEYSNETTYHEAVTFNGYISGSTLYVNYTNGFGSTQDTSIVVIEINSTTNISSGYAWDNRTADEDFQYTVSVNTGNCYKVRLFLNHTEYGAVSDSFIVCVKTGITTKSRFDTLFDLNYKHNPFGWANTFGMFLIVFGLFSFGQANSGISLLMTGFILLFVNNVVGLALMGVVVPVLLIVLGILVTWSMHRRTYG